MQNKSIYSERVGVNVDFDTLTCPICQIFFEICKFRYRGSFFQKQTLGHFLKCQLYDFHDILNNCETFVT